MTNPIAEPLFTPQNMLKDSSTRTGQLEVAFREFVEATKDLELSQKQLADEVHRLTEDLARTNAVLKNQIAAKEKIALDLAALISVLPSAVIILQNNRVVAFNEISERIVPGLNPGTIWQHPKAWQAIDNFHFRAVQRLSDRGETIDLILRPETRELEEGRELLIIHDVTTTFLAREEAEREAKLAAMGRMTAEIAHQLRTPLSTAILYASHLADASIQIETKLSFVPLLNQQLTWLDRLVSRMMSFLVSKPSTLEMVTVAEMIEDCRKTIAPLFETQEVLLECNIEGGEHLIAVRRDQLRGGIVALLENALQASTPYQSVFLSAKAAQSRVSICIEDEGPGIDADILHRIFEPFATGKSEGTGLGLAIAKSAVEVHRGELHASNRIKGGAVFQIVLPVFESL
jgi:two-component system sensor histidine kinase FlrB